MKKLPGGGRRSDFGEVCPAQGEKPPATARPGDAREVSTPLSCNNLMRKLASAFRMRFDALSEHKLMQTLGPAMCMRL